MRRIANVDPFWAVDGGGNCLPGPYRPFSMARPGPDAPAPHATTGYRSGAPIQRFSQMHVAGTGGGGRYGCIGLTPFADSPKGLRAGRTVLEEAAAVGYYRARLQGGCTVEVTCAHRASLYDIHYETGRAPGLLVDLGAVIDRGGEPGVDAGISTGGYLEIIGPGRLAGRADLRGGWGHAYPYSIFCWIETEALPTPATGTEAVGARLRNQAGPSAPGATVIEGVGCQAVLTFAQATQAAQAASTAAEGSGGGETRVRVRVGVSYVSVANARAAVERELGGRDFAAVRAETECLWEHELGAITATGGDAADARLLANALYRLYCMPTDLGLDENPLWRGETPQITDLYCLWDSVRNANGLFLLIEPERSRDWINALLEIGAKTGWVPDAWIAGHGAHVQGGASSDILFAEACRKGLKDVDYAAALASGRKNQIVPPPDPRLAGRYLDPQTEEGLNRPSVPQRVSRQIEYSLQDACIAALAERLGAKEVAADARRRAEVLWTLWCDETKVFRPRTEEGAWATPFDPARPTCADFWNDPYFYEGTAVEWALGAIHLLPEIIAAHGGPEAFAAHLDAFFDTPLLYHWKEIVLHVPWLYHYVGQPSRSVARVREMLRGRYDRSRRGLPDNEDMGAQSTFIVGALCGLYPVMGTDIYLLGVPVFDAVRLRLGRSGKLLTIQAPGAGGGATRVVGATLNGGPLARAWVRHAEIAHGATIHLTLAEAAAPSPVDASPDPDASPDADPRPTPIAGDTDPSGPAGAHTPSEAHPRAWGSEPPPPFDG